MCTGGTQTKLNQFSFDWVYKDKCFRLNKKTKHTGVNDFAFENIVCDLSASLTDFLERARESLVIILGLEKIKASSLLQHKCSLQEY